MPTTRAATTTTTTTAEAKGKSRQIVDPWNSTSSGHQNDQHHHLARSTAWRQSRTAKLAVQFRAGHGGGRRRAESTNSDQDHRCPRPGADDASSSNRGRRIPNQTNLIEMWTRTGIKPKHDDDDDDQKFGRRSKRRRRDDDGSSWEKNSTGVFDGLCFYINASTAPLVSDHRLKHLIAEHGGRVALTLARRLVTHVVLNRPTSSISSSSSPSSRSVVEMRGGGCGGGLAAGKYHKEIGRLGNVKYVTVEW